MRTNRGVVAASLAMAMGLALLALASPAGATERGRGGGERHESCRDRLYTVDSYSDQVSVVDTRTNEVTATVPVGKAPAWAVFTPDRRLLYVSNSGAASISVIDVATNAVVRTFATDEQPIGLAFTPDGRKLVVSYLPGSMQIFDVATDAAVATFAVGFDPEQIRITPDGRYVYAASTFQGIYKIDVEQARVVATIPIKDPNGGWLPFPYNLTISRDGTRVYVANTFGGFIAVIDARRDAVVQTFPALGAVGLQLSRDQRRLYVTNFWTASLDEYDAFTGEALRTSGRTAIDLPSHLVAGADGTRMYFGQSFDTKLLVFDVVRWKPVATIEVGVGPNSVVICNSASPR